MAITVVGTAGANSTSVTIPTHTVGDLILVSTHGSSAAPTVPTAGGTVPAWSTLQTGFADSVGLVSAFFVATATTTTTGTWTGAQHIVVIVLHGTGTLSTSAGRSSTGNLTSTTTMVYPALAGITSGSTGVRIGTRLIAGTAVGDPPAGWTTQITQPSASPAVSLHTLGLTADLSDDTVTGMASSTASRCHTVEVLESGGTTTATVIAPRITHF